MTRDYRSNTGVWSLRSDSNRRPAHYECAALPTELPRPGSAAGGNPGTCRRTGGHGRRGREAEGTAPGLSPQPGHVRRPSPRPDSERSFEGRTDRATTLQHRCKPLGANCTEEGTGAWFGAFVGGRLVAQLGLFDAGDGYARYQHVETDPAARRQGLAGTLVWHAGRYGREVLHARTLVIVADPADVAIRVYCACGLTDRESQFSFARPST